MTAIHCELNSSASYVRAFAEARSIAETISKAERGESAGQVSTCVEAFKNLSARASIAKTGSLANPQLCQAHRKLEGVLGRLAQKVHRASLLARQHPANGSQGFRAIYESMQRNPKETAADAAGLLGGLTLAGIALKHLVSPSPVTPTLPRVPSTLETLLGEGVLTARSVRRLALNWPAGLVYLVDSSIYWGARIALHGLDAVAVVTEKAVAYPLSSVISLGLYALFSRSFSAVGARLDADPNSIFYESMGKAVALLPSVGLPVGVNLAHQAAGSPLDELVAAIKRGTYNFVTSPLDTTSTAAGQVFSNALLPMWDTSKWILGGVAAYGSSAWDSLYNKTASDIPVSGIENSPYCIDREFARNLMHQLGEPVVYFIVPTIVVHKLAGPKVATIAMVIGIGLQIGQAFVCPYMLTDVSCSLLERWICASDVKIS